MWIYVTFAFKGYVCSLETCNAIQKHLTNYIINNTFTAVCMVANKIIERYISNSLAQLNEVLHAFAMSRNLFLFN